MISEEEVLLLLFACGIFVTILVVLVCLCICLFKFLLKITENEENNVSRHPKPSDLETGRRVEPTTPQPRTQKVATSTRDPSIFNNPAYENWYESNLNNQNVLPYVDRYFEDDRGNEIAVSQLYVSEPRTLLVKRFCSLDGIPSRLQNKHFCEPPLTLKKAEGIFFQKQEISERNLFFFFAIF